MGDVRRLTARAAALALAIAITGSVGGCDLGAPTSSSTATRGFSPEGRGDLGHLTYRAVDRLLAEVPDLVQGRAIVVSSIADEQHLDKTSPFGNLVADLARTHLVQKGVVVSEMRLRSAVLLDQKQGAITLANDRSLVVPPPNAVAILTGTYAASDQMIYVSLKLVGISDARIVGAVDFEVPRRGSETLLAPAT